MAKYLISIMAALLALCSCSTNVVYDQFVTMPQGGWPADSLAVFRTEIQDTTVAYDIYFQVRNNNDYAYSNLWLFVDIVAPDGHMQRDTLECLLADPDGTWRGGGWGSLYTEKCPYKLGCQFIQSGPYTFRIVHGMRADQLEGIQNVGLLIECSQIHNQ